MVHRRSRPPHQDVRADGGGQEAPTRRAEAVGAHSKRSIVVLCALAVVLRRLSALLRPPAGLLCRPATVLCTPAALLCLPEVLLQLSEVLLRLPEVLSRLFAELIHVPEVVARCSGVLSCRFSVAFMQSAARLRPLPAAITNRCGAPRKSLRECSSGHPAFCPGDRACSSGTVLIEKPFPRVEKAFANVHPGITHVVPATARVHLAPF
jgi:hypothetical protein